MQTTKWLLYGATGFTGKLILEQAAGKGITPVIAGRNKEKVEALATKYNCESIVFEAEQAEEAIAQLKDVKLLLNCAGPFISTYQPIVEACLKHKIHYLDITGEWVVLDAIQNLHGEAVKQNVILMPAVGFDVVPTDCMSRKLSEQIENPDTLELAFAGLGSTSRGTMKSGLHHLPGGNKIRKNGTIITVPHSSKFTEMEFEGRTFKMATIPWGDIVTAYHTTGIPNISVKTAFPSKMLSFMPFVNILKPLFGISPIRKFFSNYIDKKMPEGPDEKTRSRSFTYVYGKVSNANGDSFELKWKMQEGYTLTSITAVEIVNKLLQQEFNAGFHTPAGLFGYEWFLSLDGVEVL